MAFKVFGFCCVAHTGVLGSLYGSHYTDWIATGVWGHTDTRSLAKRNPREAAPSAKKNMWEVRQEVLLPQPHPLFFHGWSPGSGWDFYTHVEMLPHDKITTSMDCWKCSSYMGDPSLIGYCSLGVANTFAIFSLLDIWEASGTHQRVSHLASHMLFQQRPAGGDSPAIYFRSDLGLKNQG